MVLWFFSLLACRTGAPDRAPPPEHWEKLVMAGRQVGVGWTARSQTTAWREERYLWEIEGSRFPVRTTLRAEVGEDGRVSRLEGWRNGTPVGRWSGEPAHWLELGAREGTLPAGTVRALEPSHFAVVDVEVGRADGRWSWTMGGIPTEVAHTPAGVVVRAGGLVREPVDREPTLESVDPVALVRLPAAPVAEPRSRKWSRWLVAGQERVVQVPLDLEIPRSRLLEIRELVSEVQERLAFVPTPGRADPLALLGGGYGDCSEHAALFEQLAVDRGYRVRQVSGLVYTEGRGPGLDLHAWVEVEIPPAGWVPVDPALGQAIADATHLKLAEAPDLPASLVSLAADRAIELVAVR